MPRAEVDELIQSFLASGKTRGTATRFTNETRRFFDDDGKILWITFVGERLYWGLLTSSPNGIRTVMVCGARSLAAGGGPT
jgi:hypothetical protein